MLCLFPQAQPQCQAIVNPASAFVAHPLLQSPRHTLQDLTVDADGLSLAVDVAALFRSAARVQLLRARAAWLHLPQPQHSKPWAKLQQQAADGAQGQAWQLARQCGCALVDAFRAASFLQAVQLCAQTWRLSLPQQAAVHLDVLQMVEVVDRAFKLDGFDCKRGRSVHFGRVRMKLEGYAAEQDIFGGPAVGLALHLRRARINTGVQTWCGLACMLAYCAGVVALDSRHMLLEAREARRAAQSSRASRSSHPASSPCLVCGVGQPVFYRWRAIVT